MEIRKYFGWKFQLKNRLFFDRKHMGKAKLGGDDVHDDLRVKRAGLRRM